MSGSKSIRLSRGVSTWIPHLYSGHSEGQAQDCHFRPGQGEPWVVLGTLGVGLGKLDRVYIIRFGCGRGVTHNITSIYCVSLLDKVGIMEYSVGIVEWLEHREVP